MRYDKLSLTPQMEYIDYGLGLFHPRVFAELPPRQPADLAASYQKLIQAGQLLAYAVAERFYEIGSFEGLHELDQLLKHDPYHFHPKD